MKTRRMFLVALCGVAMIVGASSCKKEKNENENVGKEMRIEASLGVPDGGQKTHLDGTKVVWDSEDSFMLYSGSEGELFEIEPSEAGGTSATFVGARPGAAPFYACYPSDATRTADGFTYTVSDDQSGNMAAISTVNAGPMAAYYTGSGNLTFKNVMSWLNIGLKGNAMVKKLVLSDKSSGAILNGKMTITMDEGEITDWTMSEGNNSLYIESEDGFQLRDGDTDDVYTWFRFLVPTNSFVGENVVEIKVYGADLNIPIKTYAKTLQHTDTQGGVHQGVEANKIYSPKISEPINVAAPSVQIVDGCANCTQTIGGKVTVSSGTQYCEYGLVYSKTEAVPEIGKSGCEKQEVNAESISGIKDFDADLATLNDGPYYVRAYAIGQAVAYSEDVVVYDTPKPLPSNWTNGRNPHPFTVGSGKVVYFSQGNLQYRANSNTWRFAEHQFDYIGDNNENISNSYDGWIDLFGWGTSGYTHGAVCYQPWSSTEVYDSYFAYGDRYKNLYDGADNIDNADWGYNAINNGGNAENNGWRTLTCENEGDNEWDYLIYNRPNAEYLYGHGKVGSCTLGLIILPDNWMIPSGLTFTPGSSDWINVYSYSDWAKMEFAGAVFLPASGYRIGLEYGNEENGYYWSSSYSSLQGARNFDFKSNDIDSKSAYYRYGGFSVRLVKDAN